MSVEVNEKREGPRFARLQGGDEVRAFEGGTGKASVTSVMVTAGAHLQSRGCRHLFSGARDDRADPNFGGHLSQWRFVPYSIE
jgi:hypothetical protein